LLGDLNADVYLTGYPEDNRIGFVGVLSNKNSSIFSQKTFPEISQFV